MNGKSGELLRFGLAALDAAGVPYRLRRDGPTPDDDSGPELDIWLSPGDRRAADAALRPSGFHHLPASGHESHRFYVACSDGSWAKIDAKLPGRRRRGRLWNAFARRRPAGVRRRGPVVAVLGPDGAGKGTVIAMLQQHIPLAVTALYLGRPRRKRAIASPVPTGPRHSGDGARELAFVLWRFISAARVLLRGHAAAWRGDVVLCDRHPLEALAARPAEATRAGSLQRFLVERCLPRPDRLVVLDAPGHVLHERSGQHSAELLERARRSYVETFKQAGAVVVPAVDAPETVAAQVSEIVWSALCERRGWAG